MSPPPPPITVGVPVYPGASILDFAGPWQLLALVPPYARDAPRITQVLAATTRDPVLTLEGMRVVPDHTFADCPELDVLLVPGGPGQLPMMEDAAYQEFLRERGPRAKWVASVCVGALLLAQAGLLDGYAATTHWASLPVLQLYPRVKVARGYPRYVVDGNRITGGGMSSGMDQAVALAALLVGEAPAAQAQLVAQYAPRPPFADGDPSTASPDVLAAATCTLAKLVKDRREQVQRLLGGGAPADEYGRGVT